MYAMTRANRTVLAIMVFILTGWVSACVGVSPRRQIPTETSIAEVPLWLDIEGFHDTNPSGAVMGYLRSVRQGLYEITYYYLSRARRGKRDSRSFAQEAEGKMDWFPFGYTVHNEKVLDDDRAVVTVITLSTRRVYCHSTDLILSWLGKSLGGR